MTHKKLPYYSFDAIYSYNAIYMFITGGRGIGKTYGMLKRSIQRYLKHREQFIYLRRYKPEIVSSKATFFAAVSREFPDLQFRVNGSEGQLTRDGENWETICYFATLSTAQSYKGASFANVYTIIYDEYIIERGHTQYLPDEAKVFDNFYLTVDRFQDRVKAVFLANSVSIMNPYFSRYNVVPNSDNEFLRYAGGDVVFHFPDSKEFSDAVYQTRFGRMIKDTEFADYAVGNEFVDNNDYMVGNKDSRAAYAFTVKAKEGYVSVWHDMMSGRMFIQEKRPQSERIIATDAALMDGHCMLMRRSSPHMQMLRRGFDRGRMYFDSPRSRNIMQKLLG